MSVNAIERFGDRKQTQRAYPAARQRSPTPPGETVIVATPLIWTIK